jgi:putative acetyltransferase
MAAPSIRPATPRDWDGFRAAFGAVAAEGRWIGRELPIDWDGLWESFCQRVADPRWLNLLAEADGEVIGWAHAEHQRDGKVSLGMGIVDGYRSAGLGSRLLELVVDWAREQDAFKVCLEVWPHNAAALRLYERFGFVVEGRHPRHWRRNDGSLWDSLSMGLVLDHDSPGGPER